MFAAAAPDGYEFSADPARLDPARAHELLVAHAFWARDRSRATQDAAVAASRNYGVYDDGGRQVAYGRVVTDEVTFAWLADVVVDPGHRGRGLARLLVEGVLADLEPLGLTRIALKASSEAHGLYEQLGWGPVEDPGAWMERPGGALHHEPRR
ncbi:GNAT family N-acetyltransferase [Cellulomonas sp. Marseille-Q8402]